MPAATTDSLVIGVDLGGTNLQAAVVDRAHHIRGRTYAPTHAGRGRDAVLDSIVSAAGEAARQAGIDLDDVAAIGVATPGAIDLPRGVIFDAPNLGWHDEPIRDLLRERFGKPVVLENDVNAAVWGEYASAHRDVADMLGVWVGTGVGGGLIIGGRLHYGAFFTAGEIGQSVLLPEATPGARIVEMNCARVGFIRMLGERPGDVAASKLCEAFDARKGALDTGRLARAYESGDGLAREILDRAARLLGVAIANQVTILSLPRVVIGGGVTEEMGEPWLDLVREGFRDAVFPDRCRDCELVMTRLRADAGLIGAAMLCLDRRE